MEQETKSGGSDRFKIRGSGLPSPKKVSPYNLSIVGEVLKRIRVGRKGLIAKAVEKAREGEQQENS